MGKLQRLVSGAAAGAALLAIVTVAGEPAAAAGPTSPASAPAVTGAAAPGPRGDWSGWTVVHWAPGWATVNLDAANPENRDPRNARTRFRLRSDYGTGKPAAPAAVGYVCSLYVRQAVVPKTASGNIDGETAETCTGAFAWHETTGWVERSSWSGYRQYSQTYTTPKTTYQENDREWFVQCGTGRAGTYDYHWVAYTTAQSSEDGVIWNGPTVYGQPGHGPCGTGGS